MNFSIPMAGRGERFRREGYAVPKPLIEVHGQPMYSWAVDSLPLDLASRLVFICLNEHLERGLESDLRQRYSDHDLRIVGLPDVTSGQAATVLAGQGEYAPERPLVIYNADTVTVGSMDALGELGPDVAGALAVFRAEGDHWSFARCDSDGRVVETAEKRRISDLASTGLYHFARAGDFEALASVAIRTGARDAGEHYVAPLYNRMIERGDRNEVVEVSDVIVLGTPRELAENAARLAN